MEERRVRQRRVTGERRKGERRVAQGQPGTLEGVMSKGRGEIVHLNCPVCRAKITGFDPMVEHLATEHHLGKRQAKFLAQKLIEWRQGGLDPILFPQADDNAKGH